MCSSESKPALFPVWLNVRLRVLNALVVAFHVDSTRLFLAPGLLSLGEWLLRKRVLKSGWRAGTEAAMTPMFCSRLKFADGN